MPDIMAFTSATPVGGRYDGASPIGTPPASTKAELFRLEFIKSNGRRLETEAKLVVAKVAGDFDQDELRRANGAIREAISVVSPVDFGEMPWIDISDDCIVSMHWERCEEGVLITFTGNGAIAFAVRTSANGSYLHGFTERNASEGLPEGVRSAISRLSQVKAALTAA